MAGGVFSGAKLNGMTIRESATDGSDFTNPDADYRRLFLGEDGQLHVKDSAGAVTDIGGAGVSVATDALFDAKGDLPVGTGPNTAAKLTVGANGTRPEAASGEATGIKWSYPPGYEFDYAAFTGDVNISATVEASADTIVTGAAIAYDGATIVKIEFFCSQTYFDAAGRLIQPILFDGSSAIGKLGVILNTGADANFRLPFTGSTRITPSAATHTYSVRAITNAGTQQVSGGAGGAGNLVPGFIQITKI